jgi:hypothetical protein
VTRFSRLFAILLLAPVVLQDPRPGDRVARLAAELEAGERVLVAADRRQLLDALLAALEVPASSQTTVFSRTSFQAKRITPRHPRALYFSDDVYVAFVPDGDVLVAHALLAQELPQSLPGAGASSTWVGGAPTRT